MKIARLYLLGFGLLSVGFGLGYLFAPVALTEPAGFTMLSPSATTDVRATYGGFQIGLGAFLLWSALSADRHRSALLLTALSIGSVFVSRLLGVLIDGDLNDFHRAGLIFESSLTALTVYVLRKS